MVNNKRMPQFILLTLKISVFLWEFILIIRVLLAFVSKQMVKCYDMVDGNAWVQGILAGTPQGYQNQMAQKQKKLVCIHFKFQYYNFKIKYEMNSFWVRKT